MKKKLTFLGIETSCDETAASIVQENGDGTAKVLSNIVSSQIQEHKKFGGVVPEIAARAHVENIDFIITVPDVSHREEVEFPEWAKSDEFERLDEILRKSTIKAVAVITNAEIIKDIKVLLKK